MEVPKPKPADLLKQPSTYAGLAGMAMAAGVLTQGQAEGLTATLPVFAASIFSLVSIFKHERGK